MTTESFTPCNCSALRQATRVATQLYDQCLAPSGLRVTQYSILANLDRLAPVAVQSLADHLVLDRTSLSHNLGPLQRQKLVEIQPGVDRRVREVVLTPKGKLKLDQARPLWDEAQRRFEAAVGADEAKRLRGQLAAAVRTTAGVLDSFEPQRASSTRSSHLMKTTHEHS
jgi:DNA-binding MarR family transcriptional regulator